MELTARALAPVLQNARAFIPTAAAVLAGRYLDNTPGWSSLNEEEQQHRLALRAGRLAESIKNFHGVAMDGEEDGQGSARTMVGRVGLATAAGDPSPFSFSFAHTDGGGGGGGSGGGEGGGAISGGGSGGGGGSSGGEGGDGEGGFDDEVRTGLRLHPVFLTFTKLEMDAVRRRSDRVSVDMGQRLFRQGEAGSSMFIVVRVGPGRYCSPRHPTHFESSFLDLYDTL